MSEQWEYKGMASFAIIDDVRANHREAFKVETARGDKVGLFTSERYAKQAVADHAAATELADARAALRHICDDVDLEWRDYKAKYGDDHDKFPQVQDIARAHFAKYPDAVQEGE